MFAWTVDRGGEQRGLEARGGGEGGEGKAKGVDLVEKGREVRGEETGEEVTEVLCVCGVSGGDVRNSKATHQHRVLPAANDVEIKSEYKDKRNEVFFVSLPFILFICFSL